jgi:hypothetical protein
LIILTLLARPAWAYLDRGTGSMLLQVILDGQYERRGEKGA